MSQCFALIDHVGIIQKAHLQCTVQSRLLVNYWTPTCLVWDFQIRYFWNHSLLIKRSAMAASIFLSEQVSFKHIKKRQYQGVVVTYHTATSFHPLAFNGIIQVLPMSFQGIKEGCYVVTECNQQVGTVENLSNWLQIGKNFFYAKMQLDTKQKYL